MARHSRVISGKNWENFTELGMDFSTCQVKLFSSTLYCVSSVKSLTETDNFRTL